MIDLLSLEALTGASVGLFLGTILGALAASSRSSR